MSATLTFWRHVPTEGLGIVADQVTGWYAAHFPETASAADIASLRELSNKLAHRVAEIEGDLEHDQQTVNELTDKLARDKQASAGMAVRLKTAQDAGDTEQVAQITQRLTRVMDEMAKVVGEDGAHGLLALAKAKLSADTANLARFKEGLNRTVLDWTTRDSELRQSRADLQRAQEESRQAQADAAQAERDSGLLHTPQAGHVASSAMAQQIAALQTNTRASVVKTEALRSVHAASADVDDIVKEELAAQAQGVAPIDKGNDALARLAKLTGGGA